MIVEEVGEIWEATAGRRHVLACGWACRRNFEALLEGQEVAAIVADPPYASGGTSAAARKSNPIAKYQQSGTRRAYPSFAGDGRDQRSWTAWCQGWLADLWMLSTPETYAMVFSDWRQLSAATDAFQGANFIWRGLAVWDKGLGARAPHQGYLRHQCEYILWGTAGDMPAVYDRGKTVPGCYSCSVEGRKIHLTQKPVEVIAWLLDIVRLDGVIVDPFVGSGSSVLAADKMGRASVVTELSPEILSATLERLQKEGFRVRRLRDRLPCCSSDESGRLGDS